jgi:hypothetical protein
MNLTIGREPKSGEWRYFIGLQQQDLVFYLADSAGDIQLLEQPLATYHWLSRAEHIEKRLRVPLLVCELKLKRNLTTHQLITYSSIAEQIKSVHPHCGYFLIAGGQATREFMHETILRQAKAFDRVFLDWDQQKSDRIWPDIQAHLTYLRDRARIIGGESAA